MNLLRSCGAIAVVLLLASPPATLVGQSKPAGELTLGAAVDAALRANPVVLAGVHELSASNGGLLTESGRFSSNLTTSVLRESDRRFDVVNGVVTEHAAVSQGIAYGVALSRLTRWGALIEPGFTVNRLSAGGDGIGTADVNLTFTVPLLQDRFGQLSNVSERVARVQVETAELELEAVAASAAVEAAKAYWAYLAAQRKLEVHTTSVDRARRLVDETGILVQADERPMSDLAQVEANLASREVARDAARLDLVATRGRLVLAMGGEPDELDLPLATSDFASIGQMPDDTDSDARWIDLALRRRPELTAARRREQMAESRLTAAKHRLSPRFDLVIGVGYSGLSLGDRSAVALDPLFRHVAGPSTSVQLRYQLPITNDQSRGAVIEAQALYERQRVETEAFERRLRVDVATAAEALRLMANMAESASRAVSLNLEGVGHQRSLYQLGMATIFDLLRAEDALTIAQLALISTHQSYSEAILSLRFQTATLVEASEGEFKVDTAGFTTFP